MAEIVLFHHVQGLTEGLRRLAALLEDDGHTVHLPDLFGGRTFETIPDGIAFQQSLDEDETARAVAAVIDPLPADLAYIGFSWGVQYAQRFTQTRDGARGGVFFDSCLPLTGDWAFGPWPDGVPVQIHGKEDDEFFAHEGDIDAAREIVATIGPELAELYVYPGDQHLFADSSLASYDPEAAALAIERTRAFLTRIS
ncbi:dienelactone hydrolase [Beutenbergia cavernae DSM 12333]|uniref:Dienelactone hydrolase n=2 Tax=Beutenbergia TaxID=84756 RepID=C5C3Q7_BEUC1|nr:dienelactone hydrolase [Beutenbergia cavernae DSM 12333]